MIESVTGKIYNLNPATVVLETAGGVGYLLNISLPTFSVLEGREEVRLLVHESIREDAWVLYGFLDEDEREMFRALLGVSGVGAASARMILSTFTAADLRIIISSSDVRSLKSVKGVGSKTAERIIVDLRDKIKAPATTLIQQSQTIAPAYDEALQALVILGFPRQASEKVLKKIFDAEPSLSIENAIKRAMSMI